MSEGGSSDCEEFFDALEEFESEPLLSLEEVAEVFKQQKHSHQMNHSIQYSDTNLSIQSSMVSGNDSWQFPVSRFSSKDSLQDAKLRVIELHNGFPPLDSKYPLHKAVFDGDYTAITKLISTQPDVVRSLDVHGNTALHVAVIRKQSPVIINALLEAGLQVETKNTKGWTPIDEAIGNRDRDVLQMLLKHQFKLLKESMKEKKQHLLQTMSELPDYQMKLQWEFGSPVIGLLIRRYCPCDTYTIWKRGRYLRIDGSLMGVDQKKSGLLPEWKRGHFSVIFDGSQEKTQSWLLNHTKKYVYDLKEKPSKQGGEALSDPEAEVDLLLGEGAGKTKLKSSEFKFLPVKGWFTNELEEKVAGWNTVVYEAVGKLIAVTTLKPSLPLAINSTFTDYLLMSYPDNQIVEEPVTLLDSQSALSGENAKAKAESSANMTAEETEAAHQQAKKKAHRLRGRCWMASNFPMKLRQLLPLLEVIGQANKHLGKAANFMKKYSDMDMFPVKIQVPLLLTVYIMLTFKEFQLIQPVPDDFFQVPSDYQLKSLESALKKEAKFHGQNQGQDLQYIE
eukprot:TRINITY_DN7693_c0_g1_i12.p1 TRINITY_DN7693_c0_g1~~TRINITY_DN7693_c0_g1_i12.p1  ORF type:complete len:562 (-),score=88.43 TRINITY_DN7693_c0_g1_i12:574-2259(-)